MPIVPPSGKELSLHKLMAMSTMLSPTHHMHPLIQAGGGDATSEVPAHQLTLSHGIREHLKRVYDQLRGFDHTLSREKFTAWFEKVQAQPMTGMDHETYKFEEFLALLFRNKGLEATKELKPEEKDLSRPISNYFISSSHNTYLSGNQLSSKSSTEAYKNVLIRGCRCIEIDVHNGEDSKEHSKDNIKSSEISQVMSHGTIASAAPTSPRPDHKRHISGSTISSFAAEASEKIEAKIKSAKSKISGTGLGINLLHPDKSSETLSGGSSIERPPSIRSMRNGEPLVLHGWTLTAPVGFRDVCRTIRQTAFTTSNLPIIVSLEVHANLEQQEVMVSIMKEEWKGYLIDEAHETCNPEERLPRLDELLNKILIKVKKASTQQTPQPSLEPRASGNSLAPVTSRNDGESGGSASEDERVTKKKVKICESLSNLGIYTHSEHFVSFEAKSAKKPSHIFSIGESQIMDLHEKKREEMFAHNRDYFMRAYPAGFRIDSSNLDPSTFWRKGVQMVALNWQNCDEGVMLNEGMFAGEHGWVLKPPGYRSDSKEPIPFKTVHLTVTIFAGQHIPLPEGQHEKGFHPSIRCELHAEKPEEKRYSDSIESIAKLKGGEWKHRTPAGKGDHPDFGKDGVVLDFPQVDGVLEELSFVRFKVEDSKYTKDDLAAWACIRLDRLQPGYRFVRLLDAKGLATAGLLLVKIDKTVL